MTKRTIDCPEPEETIYGDTPSELHHVNCLCCDKDWERIGEALGVELDDTQAWRTRTVSLSNGGKLKIRVTVPDEDPSDSPDGVQAA